MDVIFDLLVLALGVIVLTRLVKHVSSTVDKENKEK